MVIGMDVSFEIFRLFIPLLEPVFINLDMQCQDNEQDETHEGLRRQERVDDVGRFQISCYDGDSQHQSPYFIRDGDQRHGPEPFQILSPEALDRYVFHKEHEERTHKQVDEQVKDQGTRQG
jgi:hypothetical protein